MAAIRRRGVADAPRKTTQRVNLQIDAESYERLLIHSIKGKEQPGAIVSRLIDEHLKTWALPAKLTARAPSTVSASPAGPGEPTLQDAA